MKQWSWNFWFYGNEQCKFIEMSNHLLRGWDEREPVNVISMRNWVDSLDNFIVKL